MICTCNCPKKIKFISFKILNFPSMEVIKIVFLYVIVFNILPYLIKNITHITTNPTISLFLSIFIFPHQCKDCWFIKDLSIILYTFIGKFKIYTHLCTHNKGEFLKRICSLFIFVNHN